jgi:hypothetical protein
MHLDDAIPAMQQFLLAMVADKTIPLPGDVDVMTGGPPCQVREGVRLCAAAALRSRVCACRL